CRRYRRCGFCSHPRSAQPLVGSSGYHAGALTYTHGSRELSLQGTALMFLHYHSGRRLTDFELGVRFLDLHGVVFQLGGECRYFLLLLRDCCLQVLNCTIEHGLLGSVGNGLGPDVAFGGKSTRVRSMGSGRAQSPIGIDHHHSSRGGGNRRTEDIINGAPVTDLTKDTVHARVMTNDDI